MGAVGQALSPSGRLYGAGSSLARINWFGRQECLPYILRVAQNLRDAAEGSRGTRTVAPHPHGAAGGQAADVAEHGVGIGHVSPQKVADVSGRIGGEIDFRSEERRVGKEWRR